MKSASGACRRVASSTFSVPTALTSKSTAAPAPPSRATAARRCGRRARSPAVAPEEPQDRVAVADVDVLVTYLVPSACSTRVRFHRVEPSGPKKALRMSLSMPTTSWPSSPKNTAASEPMRPLEPVITATVIGAPLGSRWLQSREFPACLRNTKSRRHRRAAENGAAQALVCSKTWSPRS